MLRLFSSRNRKSHLGPFPLERVARDETCSLERAVMTPAALPIEAPDAPNSMRNAMRDYIDLMDRMRLGVKAAQVAPVPDDLTERAEHLKAACYYLDASMAATCRVPPAAILDEPVVNAALELGAEREYAVGSAENKMAEASVREGREAWARAQAQAGEFSDPYALVILTEFPRDPGSRRTWQRLDPRHAGATRSGARRRGRCDDGHLSALPGF